LFSAQGGVRLYFSEITTLAIELLGHRSWEVKKQAAAALTAVAMNSNADVLQTSLGTVFPPLLEALAGRAWEGKYAVVECAVTLITRSKDAGLAATLYPVVLRECQRKARDYRLLVLPSLKTLVEAFALDALVDICDLVRPLVTLQSLAVVTGDATNVKASKTSKDGDDDSVDGGNAADALALRVACWQLLAVAVAVAPVSSFATHMDDLWALVLPAMAVTTWKLKLEVIATARALVVKVMCVGCWATFFPCVLKKKPCWWTGVRYGRYIA
jgi:hypothetical protein